MPRRESDREDLLREATALIQRAELSVPGFDEPIVIGFRRGGSISFYFGGDPVYQFNSAGQLRRAYIDGLLYKAERGQLIALRRERDAEHVALVRSEVDEVQTRELLLNLRTRLDGFQATLMTGSFKLLREIPPGGQVVLRIVDWLAELPAEIGIAAAPNVR